MTKTQTKWLQLIKDWEVSDLTQTAFCEQQGITKASFSKWRSQFIASGECASRRISSGFKAVDNHEADGFIPFSIHTNNKNDDQSMIEITLLHGITLKVPAYAYTR